MTDVMNIHPEWISPPGSIVARILDRREIALDDFAIQVGLSSRNARGLIEGTTAIDDELARSLSAVVGSTASFWLRCEHTYRADVDRNIAAYVDDDVRVWMKQLPIRELANLGWLQQHRDPIRQAQECFKFFGVIGLEDWRRKQERLLAGVNFRTSFAFRSEPGATAAWLRWAEDQAEDVACRPWDRSAFANKLSQIRSLTRNHHPEKFVPQLKKLCAEAGVAVIIAPAPKGCSASGATRLIRGRKAMIVLSFRYFSDDQFWFTFFHEAGHLQQHVDQVLFLEEEGGELDDCEREANQFAKDVLIPPSFQDEMAALPHSHDAYIAFARRIGIAPGIVVGQMQRLRHLPFSWLNKVKRNFDWNLLYQNGIIP